MNIVVVVAVASLAPQEARSSAIEGKLEKRFQTNNSQPDQRACLSDNQLVRAASLKDSQYPPSRPIGRLPK